MIRGGTMYHRFSKVFMILLISILLTGCNLDSIGDGIRSLLENFADGKTCSDIKLSATTGQPLDIISLSVIPSDFTNMLAIQVESNANHNEKIIPAMAASESGGAEFVVPVHPNATIQGGNVSLTIMDDTGKTCELPSFTIKPLEKAEGAFEELTELIKEVNEAQGNIIGTRQQSTPVTPGDADLTIDLSGDIVEGITSDPANPNSLDKVNSGDAPVTADLTEAGWEIIDSLVEKSGATKEMDKVKNELEKVGEIN